MAEVPCEESVTVALEVAGGDALPSATELSAPCCEEQAELWR